MLSDERPVSRSSSRNAILSLKYRSVKIFVRQVKIRKTDYFHSQKYIFYVIDIAFTYRNQIYA